LKAGSAEERSAAIRLLGRRRAEGVGDVLLGAARTGDESVRVTSLVALAAMAGRDEFAGLLDILLSADSDKVIKAAGAALSAACGRMALADPSRVKIRKAVYGNLPDGGTKDVTAAVAAMVAKGKLKIDATNGNFGDPTPGERKRMRVDYSVDGTALSETVEEGGTIVLRAGTVPADVVDKLSASLANASEKEKLALLEVLGAAGGKKALSCVQSVMQKGSEEERRTAESVFCAWPGAEALPALFELARTTKSTRSKVLALRGCCRLIPLASASDGEKLTQVKEVLALAERVDEKRLALSALSEVHVGDALAVAMEHVGQGGLREEACLAAVSIAEKLRAKHREDVAKAMAVVLKQSDNKRLKRRARVAMDKAQGSK